MNVESIYFCGVQNFGSDDMVSPCILMLLVFLVEKVKVPNRLHFVWGNLLEVSFLRQWLKWLKKLNFYFIYAWVCFWNCDSFIALSLPGFGGNSSEELWTAYKLSYYGVFYICLFVASAR